MKKYLIITVGLLTAVLTMNSCKEEVDLVSGFKETAIVYGILDKNETIHYIKIQRAFIGPGSSLDIAKSADSNYFENVEAKVVEYVNNIVTKTWILGDTILHDKSTDGIFFAPDQKLYYFTDAEQGVLNDQATYKLNITVNKGQENELVITGETKLVSGITCKQGPLGQNFNFIKTTNGVTSLISDEISTLSNGEAFIMNASLKVEFYEFQDNTLLDSVSYSLLAGESVVAPHLTYNTSILGETFFKSIVSHASSNPLINHRKLKGLTICLTGGSEVLNNYINANKPSSSLAQTKPSYTNLSITKDKNVIGIFTSRQTVNIFKAFAIGTETYSALETKTREELCTGTITGNLFFCSDHNLDAAKPFHCP
jgi:hypothetical protein